MTAWLAERGFEVIGVDPSLEDIAQAWAAHPNLGYYQLSAYDPLREELGSFSLVLSLEVVEHVYAPTACSQTVHDVLVPGGLAVLSTADRGWLKNMALAPLDHFDDPVGPLFWSRRTLTRLLEETGFEVERFRYGARIPPLARLMIAVARRPETGRRLRLHEGG